MKTFFLIILSFIVISIVNTYIVSKEKKRCKKNNERFTHKRVSSRVNSVVIAGLITMFIGIFVINCSGSSEVNDEKEEILNEEIEAPLNENQQFLSDNGMYPYVEMHDGDIDIIKKAVAKGIFSKKSFCDLYTEMKTHDYNGNNKASNSIINSLKEVENLDYIFMVYGVKLCPNAISKAQINHSGFQEIESSVVCMMSIDFIKKDLRYPKTIDYSMFDCTPELKADNSYIVLRKISAKNAFGVESEFIYKVRIGYKGGEKYNINNWKLISIQSEEVRY